MTAARRAAFAVRQFSVALAAMALGSAGCKARDFNATAVRSTAATPPRTAPPAPRESRAANELRAGLSIVFPAARDERGLLRLMRLSDLGFTADRFASLLTVALGDAPTPSEIESGDVFNRDTPERPRTLTNESCMRDVASWKLTHVQFLPYERLVPGSYAAVAQWEKEKGRRLVAPLVIRGTFQPWCLSDKASSRAQIFVLEQALQVEWRVLDLDASRQTMLARIVEERVSSNDDAAFLSLAEAFETTESANARQEVVREVAMIAASWRKDLRTVDPAAFEPLDDLFQTTMRDGDNAAPAEGPRPSPVHPGFATSAVLDESLRVVLGARARKETLHLVRTSLSESQGPVVHAVVRFEGEKAVPVEIVTRQMMRRAPPAEKVASGNQATAGEGTTDEPRSTWEARALLKLGRFVSRNDTGNTPAFESDDAAVRRIFDAVDMAPELISQLPAAEVSATRKRIFDVNRVHKTTTHCSLCHTLGGGKILSGHRESEGPRMAAASFARAAEDASALSRELSRLGTP
jgi:hypothetical protein